MVPLGAIVALAMAGLLRERLTSWLGSLRPRSGPATADAANREPRRIRLVTGVAVAALAAVAVLVILILSIEAGVGWNVVFD